MKLLERLLNNKHSIPPILLLKTLPCKSCLSTHSIRITENISGASALQTVALWEKQRRGDKSGRAGEAQGRHQAGTNPLTLTRPLCTSIRDLYKAYAPLNMMPSPPTGGRSRPQLYLCLAHGRLPLTPGRCLPPSKLYAGGVLWQHRQQNCSRPCCFCLDIEFWGVGILPVGVLPHNRGLQLCSHPCHSSSEEVQHYSNNSY